MLQLLKPKSSSSSSVSSSSSSAPKLKPAKKQKKELDDYCKAINATLAKGGAITPSDANVTQFSMTIDLLTKASALCGAMQATTQDAASSSSSSSTGSWWSSSSSSSSQMYDPLKALHQCKKLSEETNPITKLKMCKYICGTSITDIKTQVCPKE